MLCKKKGKGGKGRGGKRGYIDLPAPIKWLTLEALRVMYPERSKESK